MRSTFIILLYSTILSSLLLSSGCATASVSNESSNNIVPDSESPLQEVESNKQELMKESASADDVNTKVAMEDSIAGDDEKITYLKAGRNVTEDPSDSRDKRDGFKSTKERTIVYGPVGAVLRFTEWLLEKLYIMHSD